MKPNYGLSIVTRDFLKCQNWMDRKSRVMGKKIYKIGYTAGVFDLFHVGHLNLLERCKEKCDILIVGVCNDEYVTKIKKRKPIFSQEERIKILNALKMVDKADIISVEEANDKKLAFERVHFDVLFSGDDWKGSEMYLRTEKELFKYGVVVEYIPYTKGISTSKLKEKISQSL